MLILLDMDGPICDFVKGVLDQYNHLTGENVKRNDITKFYTHKCLKHPNIGRRIIDSVGFMRGLEPTPGAIDGINTLYRQKHDIAFVSNGTNCPTSGHEKRDWLKYYFGNLWEKAPLVLTANKYLVPGDCLLDDKPSNLEGLKYGTKPLLWDCSYNRNVDKYDRIYDWSHFLDWVDSNSK